MSLPILPFALLHLCSQFFKTVAITATFIVMSRQTILQKYVSFRDFKNLDQKNLLRLWNGIIFWNTMIMMVTYIFELLRFLIYMLRAIAHHVLVNQKALKKRKYFNNEMQLQIKSDWKRRMIIGITIKCFVILLE